MSNYSLIFAATVAMAALSLGITLGNAFPFKDQDCASTASQVTSHLKQDREKTIVDLINENP